MADIRSPALLYAKGALFLVVGGLTSALLVVEHPVARTAVLLGLAVWGFSRAYYFSFYVVEHDIDGDYRFAGLVDFLHYLTRRHQPRRDHHDHDAAVRPDP